MTNLAAVGIHDVVIESVNNQEINLVPIRRRQHILAIGAHPDDVELGIGGILASHRAIGDQITILTMSDGINGGTTSERRKEAQSAADLLGAMLIAPGLADSRIGADVETIRVIEAAVLASKPDIIYTHSAADTHQDHRSIHFATLVAGRAVAGLYCYGSPSLTNDFHPVRFNDISENLQFKLSLLRCFDSQQHRLYFDPELVIAKAMYWGSVGRWRYAEPLEVIHERSPGHVELVGYVPRSAITLRTTQEDEPLEHHISVGAVYWQ